MIKNILFDVDNTIFDSGDENAIYYKEALANCGYNPERYLEVYNAIEFYEDTFDDENNLYSKENLLKLINEKLNENYPIKLIDEINNAIAKHWIQKVLIDKETLEYLSSKYNLYVFSNWFYDAPYNRLKNVDYLKYFKKVFTADNYGSKPFKKSFENVLKELNCPVKECIMVGDSIRSDINGANSVGMKSILIDFENKYSGENLNCTIINNFEQIKNIL